jgi:hypothetical protein
MNEQSLIEIDSIALDTVTGGAPGVTTSWKTTYEGWKNIIQKGTGTGFWGGYGGCQDCPPPRNRNRQ